MSQDLMTIRADWQLKPFENLIAQLEGKRLKRTLSAVVNTSAKQVKSSAVKLVSNETSIKSKRTSRGIYINKHKTDPLRPDILITASKKPVNLGHMMNVKESPKGINLKMWGQKTNMPHAFMTGGLLPNRVMIKFNPKKILAFERIKGSQRKIEAVYGPAIAESMGKDKNMNQLVTISHERIQANLSRMLERALYAQNNRFKKKAPLPLTPPTALCVNHNVNRCKHIKNMAQNS